MSQEFLTCRKIIEAHSEIVQPSDFFIFSLDIVVLVNQSLSYKLPLLGFALELQEFLYLQHYFAQLCSV